MSGLQLLEIKEILYCESQSNYTCFHLLNEKRILISKTLKNVEELLAGNNNFFRIHNSFFINLNYVNRYVKGKGGEVIMSNGKSLSVSRTKKKAFVQLLENL